jgi:hypothetical protein
MICDHGHLFEAMTGITQFIRPDGDIQAVSDRVGYLGSDGSHGE